MRKAVITTAAVLLGALALATGAEAARTPVTQFCGDRYCAWNPADRVGRISQVKTRREARTATFRKTTPHRTPRARITRQREAATTSRGARGVSPVVLATAASFDIPAAARGLWCGWYMGLRRGLRDRTLWIAQKWAHVGRPADGPAPRVIGVERHHVYEVIKVVGPGKVLAISGNDGGAVKVRVRSTARTIAWREL